MSASKITSVKARLFRAPLLKIMKIALGEITSAETVIVQICTNDGRCGYGEASPYKPVTGDTIDDALNFVNGPAQALVGMDPDGIGEIHRVMEGLLSKSKVRNTPGRASIDIALYDLASQAAGMPLYRFLGGTNPQVHSDYTVTLGSADEMVLSAKKAIKAGFDILKLKAGIDADADTKNIRAIRNAVGPNVQLRLDANQGWDEASATHVLNAMADLNIAEVEQPLPAINLAGLARLRKQVPQPIMLDESVHSPADALQATNASAGDFINIKLMKSGGLLPALKINAIAEAAGLPCMVGCMMETNIAIAAGAHLVASQGNIQLADLDSHLEISEQDVVRDGFCQTGGIIILGEAPGLGVTVDFDALG